MFSKSLNNLASARMLSVRIAFGENSVFCIRFPCACVRNCNDAMHSDVLTRVNLIGTEIVFAYVCECECVYVRVCMNDFLMVLQ